MKISKIREWSPQEMEDKEHDFLEQMFRLKFQFSMGQTDTLKKIRDPTGLDCFQAIISKRQLAAFPGLAAHAATLLLPELDFLRQ